MKSKIWLPGFGTGRGIDFCHDVPEHEICPLTMEQFGKVSTRECTRTHLQENKMNEATHAHAQKLQLKIKDAPPVKMACGHIFSCFQLLHHLSLHGDQCPVCRQGSLRSLNLEARRKPHKLQKELWEFVCVTSTVRREQRQDEEERELMRVHEEFQNQEDQTSIMNWVFQESRIFAVIFAYVSSGNETVLPPACFRVGLRFWDSVRPTDETITYRAGRSQLRTMNNLLQRSMNFTVRVDMEIDTQLYSLMSTQILQHGVTDNQTVSDTQNFGSLSFIYEPDALNRSVMTLKTIDFSTSHEKIRNALISLLQQDFI
jgi:hypothetical protein